MWIEGIVVVAVLAYVWLLYDIHIRAQGTATCFMSIGAQLDKIEKELKEIRGEELRKINEEVWELDILIEAFLDVATDSSFTVKETESGPVAVEKGPMSVQQFFRQLAHRYEDIRSARGEEARIERETIDAAVEQEMEQRIGKEQWEEVKRWRGAGRPEGKAFQQWTNAEREAKKPTLK